MTIPKDVTQAIEDYLDLLYEGDTDKMQRVFHPSAQLYSATGGEFFTLSLPEYVSLVEGRESPKSKGEPKIGRIVSVDLIGPNMFTAKVETAVAPRDFTDCLTYLKLDGRWQIISKAFHYEENS